MKKIILGLLLISMSLFAWNIFSKDGNTYTIQCDNGRTIVVSRSGDRYAASGYNSGTIETFSSLSAAVSYGCK